MKKITTIALLMLMTLGANAQKDVFNKYKDMEGVSIVRMPKFMMRLAAWVDKDARTPAERVSEIRILSCEHKSLGQKIKADAQTAYERGGYEEMMRVNEEGQRVAIYHRNLKHGKNEYAILSVGDQVAIVNIVGHLSLDDLDKVMDMTD